MIGSTHIEHDKPWNCPPADSLRHHKTYISFSAWPHILVTVVSLLFSLLAVVPCFADADISVEVTPETASSQDFVTVTVSISGESSKEVGTPQVVEDSVFKLERTDQGQSHSIVNGQVSSSRSFSFTLSIAPDTPPGTYKTPELSVLYNGKRVQLRRPSVNIVKAEDNTHSDTEPGVSFVHVVEKTNPFVGEQILYRAEIASSARVTAAELPDAPFQGFWKESYGKQRESQRVVGGGRSIVHTVREGLFPTSAGELTLPARTVTLEIQLRRTGSLRPPGVAGRGPFSGMPGLLDQFWHDEDLFGFGYTRPVTKRFTAEAIKLDVQPLPPAPVAGLKYVPVGKIKLNSKIDKNTVRQGDSVNLTIELSGDGNLRPYELTLPMELEKDFRVYQDTPELTTSVGSDRIFFNKRFVIALVPLRSGRVEIPAIPVVTFDPDSARYQILTSAISQLEVIPSSSASQLVIAGGRSGAASGGRQTTTVELLGKDLFPQKVGAELLARRSVLATGYLVAIVLIPLAVVTLCSAWRRHRFLFANPAAAARASALGRAVGRLSGSEAQTSAELAHVLRSYIGDRLMTPGVSLTPPDAYRLVAERLSDCDLAGRLRSVLEELERDSFGGKGYVTDSADTIRDKVRQLIKEIEDKS